MNKFTLILLSLLLAGMARARGMKVNTWTVDAIISNYPDRLLKVVKE